MLISSHEHRDISLKRIFVFTLVCHMLVLLVKIDFNSIKNVKKVAQYTPVKVIDLNQIEGIRKRSKIKAPPKQIVNSDQDGRALKDDRTRFLGKKTQSFDRQTIAKRVKSYKKAGQGESAKKKVTQKGKSKLKSLNLSKLGSIGFATPKPNKDVSLKTYGLKNGVKGAKGLSANNDFIEDIPLGDFTRLNTVEYKYFGFYERIRKKLEQYWGQSLTQKAKKIRSRGGRLPANENYVTSLIIYLNTSGEIVQVKMVDSAGLKELDDAALESFNKAGPFPNPPKGMLKEGRAEIKWSFVVKS